MLGFNSGLEILFVNGINTGFGGSVAESNKTWFSSFNRNGIRFESLNIVPHFGLRQKSHYYFLLLSLYFMPGTFFRSISASIFEFTYKLSPFTLAVFIWYMITSAPKQVIFSHHSIFYLALFCSRFKRIFLIHDLMYVRSRSKGASRRLQRLFFYIELKIYRLAPTVFVQSYHEWRLLKRFLNDRIYLIRCCDLALTMSVTDCPAGLAVISDWRRPENVHGIINFLSLKSARTYNGSVLNFQFFGFGSHGMVKKLVKLGISNSIVISDGGVFDVLSDIKEGYFFVPIYQGAGIKRKTLEALVAGRMVVGTRAAFIGLPPWIIAGVTWRISSVLDLRLLPKLPDAQAFKKVLDDLSSRYHDIGEITNLLRK